MGSQAPRKPFVPPRWVVVLFWKAHRAVHRLTSGRMGLWSPTATRWGTLRLRTLGRRSGRDRSVILGYYEDGPALVTMAMNGWGSAEPAWWLNLRAHPDAVAELADGRRVRVHARAAVGEERAKLWARWRQLDADLDGYASRRPSETAVVVLEPRP